MMSFSAKSGHGKERYFPTFEAAERWARWYVAESAQSEFPEWVAIYEGGQPRACVRLDGAERVWTDMR